GAIAVIAPESTRYSDRHSDRRAHPIDLGTRQPSQRSARCTYSGHSARSVVTAVITVIVTAIDALFNFITSSIQSPLLPSILLQSSQNHHHVIRLLLLYYVIYTLITHHYFHCRK
ncbi:hypothetical protein L249_5989, partial [Ophiocordyceps polyrhachis-furcata BCC 54312]